MADKPINLNRARKKRERAELARKAETSRARHGQTKAEREQARLERERAERAHESSRLDD